jgi:hypothetical protein
MPLLSFEAISRSATRRYINSLSPLAQGGDLSVLNNLQLVWLQRLEEFMSRAVREARSALRSQLTKLESALERIKIYKKKAAQFDRLSKRKKRSRRRRGR